MPTCIRGANASTYDPDGSHLAASHPLRVPIVELPPRHLLNNFSIVITLRPASGDLAPGIVVNDPTAGESRQVEKDHNNDHSRESAAHGNDAIGPSAGESCQVYRDPSGDKTVVLATMSLLRPSNAATTESGRRKNGNRTPSWAELLAIREGRVQKFRNERLHRASLRPCTQATAKPGRRENLSRTKTWAELRAIQEAGEQNSRVQRLDRYPAAEMVWRDSLLTLQGRAYISRAILHQEAIGFEYMAMNGISVAIVRKWLKDNLATAYLAFN